MFTVEQRDVLRDRLLRLAAGDARVVAGAAVGSLAVEGGGDRYSDLDLTFAVADGVPVADVLDDWTRTLTGELAAVPLAAPRANDRLRFIQGDMPRDARDGAFDLLLALDVVEHVEDDLGFLRALRPIGTQKLFFFPPDLSVQTVIRPHGLLQKRDAYGHLHYFTRETALRALTDVGYTIVDAVYTSDLIDLPTHLPGRKALKYPRKLLSALSPDFAAHLLGGYRLLVLAR